MKRRDFLKTLGAGAALMLTFNSAMAGYLPDSEARRAIKALEQKVRIMEARIDALTKAHMRSGDVVAAKCIRSHNGAPVLTECRASK